MILLYWISFNDSPKTEIMHAGLNQEHCEFQMKTKLSTEAGASLNGLRIPTQSIHNCEPEN